MDSSRSVGNELSAQIMSSLEEECTPSEVIGLMFFQQTPSSRVPHLGFSDFVSHIRFYFNRFYQLVLVQSELI